MQGAAGLGQPAGPAEAGPGRKRPAGKGDLGDEAGGPQGHQGKAKAKREAKAEVKAESEAKAEDAQPIPAETQEAQTEEST